MNVDKVDDGHYLVESSKGDSNYTVALDEEGWTCTCPAFEHETGGPQGCKHIRAVLEQLE